MPVTVFITWLILTYSVLVLWCSLRDVIVTFRGMEQVEDKPAKSAVVFLSSLYIQFLIGMITIGFHMEIWFSLMIYYILSAICIFSAGWMNVVIAVALYDRKAYGKLGKTWRLLKYGAVTFYILNGIFCESSWHMLAKEAAEGAIPYFFLFLILAALPPAIIIPCILIFQSGCAGWFCVKGLRDQNREKQKPGRIHYVLQIIPLLDMISTAFLSKKYRVINDRKENTVKKPKFQKAKIFPGILMVLVLIFVIILEVWGFMVDHMGLMNFGIILEIGGIVWIEILRQRKYRTAVVSGWAVIILIITALLYFESDIYDAIVTERPVFTLTEEERSKIGHPPFHDGGADVFPKRS